MSDALPGEELERLWECHTRLEFETRDAAAVATMTPDNYVNHIPSSRRCPPTPPCDSCRGPSATAG